MAAAYCASSDRRSKTAAVSVMSYFGYLGIQNARRRYLGIKCPQKIPRYPTSNLQSTVYMDFEFFHFSRFFCIG
jgi:hypothetical protein